MIKRMRTGPEMIDIPPGTYLMGSARYPKVHPRASHRLTRAFRLAKHVVSQHQWSEVMGSRPWLEWPADDYLQPAVGADLPAVCVSRADALAFVERLSELSGREHFLPSDAQWEYACRAGTDTECFWGDDPEGGRAFAWLMWDFSTSAKDMKPLPVGGLRPNPWGLHHMVGNVFQWVYDLADEEPDAPVPGPRHFPKGATDFVGTRGASAMRRGAACTETSHCLISARRVMAHPDERDPVTGFRVAAWA